MLLVNEPCDISQYSLYAYSFFDDCKLGNVCNDNKGFNCLGCVKLPSSNVCCVLQKSLYAFGN